MNESERLRSLVIEYVTAHRAVESFRASHFVGQILPAPLVVLLADENRAWCALCDEADRP